MKADDDRRRILHDSRDERTAGRNFTEKTVKIESGSSVFGVVLYRKDDLALTRSQKATGSSQDMFLSSEEALQDIVHCFGTLQGEEKQRKVRERGRRPRKAVMSGGTVSRATCRDRWQD